ncbi:low molecular weight protein tyrosine phosphatase family protein [Paraburkholderia sp. GAS41]|uniref:low molecular weight protein tyrosine phosphatase family protein n=1 Tax=Paraburkholderia sp. GAS41 TaxID=3035134 RepID=UPI003D20BB85
MNRALFVCSRNRLRSPTAEAVFAAWPGVETDSAGLAPDAETVLSAEQIEWAQVIFVMERAHKTKLSKGFSSQIRGKKIVCLDIPDRYEFMQPELVTVLKKKVERFLRS